jgi:hypothetical protein
MEESRRRPLSLFHPHATAATSLPLLGRRRRVEDLVHLEDEPALQGAAIPGL